jgi:hypothetical protein
MNKIENTDNTKDTLSEKNEEGSPNQTDKSDTLFPEGEVDDSASPTEKIGSLIQPNSMLFDIDD